MEPTRSHSQSHDHEWVINISRSLEGETEDNEELFSVKIFNIPKSLLRSKKEAYTPQAIALGPYHHRRLELSDTERYKLDAAKKVRNKLKPIKFSDFMTKIIALNDTLIRSFYSRFLDVNQETLAWMLAIDTSFLFVYLKNNTSDRRKQSSVSLRRRNSLKIAQLMDFTRRNTWHHTILRDIIMLENQIPLMLLTELHTLCYPEDNKNDALVFMLINFCKEISPIKHIDEQRFREQCFIRAHLLELLYDTVVANCHSSPLEMDNRQEKENNNNNKYQNDDGEVGRFKLVMNSILSLIGFLIIAPIQFFSRIFKYRLALQLINVLWKVVASVSKIRSKNAISDIVLSAGDDVMEQAKSAVAQAQAQHEEGEGLLVEEIAIPNVEELTKIGVKFSPTNVGLNSVKFDASTATFHLPVIHLNDNSEVVLRNMIAYEACIAPEGMVFTRYTELMNGIIDTEEDVRILRESGVLVNRLKSDKEVASLWNGMTASVKVTKVAVLDKAIESVNAYYDAHWKVKVKGGMKKYVYGSWPFLTFLAANLIIFFTATETVCSFYHCSKWISGS